MKKAYILLIFPLLVACGNKESKVSVEKTYTEIKTDVAFEKSYSGSTEYSGTFFANKEANLGTSMPGKIEKYYYKPGTFVKSGTLLVELSSEVLTQALIEFDAIKKDFDRVSRLKEKGSISEIEFDHIKAKLDAAQVKTDMLKKNTTVVAPFDGVIVEYLLEEGENFFFTLNIDPGYSNTSGIVRLMQLNPLKAEIQVNEQDISKIHTGQEVIVKCDAVSDKEYKGKISYIKPILSTNTRTASVEVEVQNTDGKIMPGMFARVFIESISQTGVFIPLNSIYRQPGTPEDYVFVIKNDTAYKTRISRIKSDGEFVCVSGIENGVTVAVEGKNKLNDGTFVKVIKD